MLEPTDKLPIVAKNTRRTDADGKPIYARFARSTWNQIPPIKTASSVYPRQGWVKVKELGGESKEPENTPQEAQLDKVLEAKVKAAIDSDDIGGVTVREMKEYVKGLGYGVDVTQSKADLFEDLKNIES